jgi:organic radical activating enzyme
MLAVSRGTQFNWMGEIILLSTPKCNLQCLGCITASNYVTKDPYTKEDKIDWIKTLHKTFTDNNISLTSISLQGGEMFLNDDFIDISRLIGKLFPDNKLKIFTNGTLIGKRMDWLDKLIASNKNLKFSITVHKVDENTVRDLALVKYKLISNNISFDIQGLNVPGLNLKQYDDFWRLPWRYNNDGSKIKPMRQGDELMSWTTCVEKYCNHIVDYKLFKCTKLAYLRPMLHKLKQLDDPDWQHFLGYQPLDLRTATFRDIANFAAKSVESYCDMCPAYGGYVPNDKPIYKEDYADYLSTKGIVESF